MDVATPLTMTAYAANGSPGVASVALAYSPHETEVLNTAMQAIPALMFRMLMVSAPAADRLELLNVPPGTAPTLDMVKQALDTSHATTPDEVTIRSQPSCTAVDAMAIWFIRKHQHRFGGNLPGLPGLVACRIADVSNYCIRLLDLPGLLSACLDDSLQPTHAEVSEETARLLILDAQGQNLGIDPGTLARDMQSMFKYAVSLATAAPWTIAARQGLLAFQRRMAWLGLCIAGARTTGARDVNGLCVWIDQNAGGLRAMDEETKPVRTVTIGDDPTPRMVLSHTVQTVTFDDGSAEVPERPVASWVASPTTAPTPSEYAASLIRGDSSTDPSSAEEKQRAQVKALFSHLAQSLGDPSPEHVNHVLSQLQEVNEPGGTPPMPTVTGPSYSPQTTSEQERREALEYEERRRKEDREEARRLAERDDAERRDLERKKAERDHRLTSLFEAISESMNMMSWDAGIPRAALVQIACACLQGYAVSCDDESDRESIEFAALRAVQIMHRNPAAAEDPMAPDLPVDPVDDASRDVTSATSWLTRLAASVHVPDDAVFNTVLLNTLSRIARLASKSESMTATVKRALQGAAMVAAVRAAADRATPAPSLPLAVQRAAVRVAARQSVKLALAPVEAAAVRLGMPQADAARMARSRGGTAMVSALAAAVALGVASRGGPQAAHAGAIAEELGTQALTDVGEAFLGALTGPLDDVLRGIAASEEPAVPHDAAPALPNAREEPAPHFAPDTTREPVGVASRPKGST